MGQNRSAFIICLFAVMITACKKHKHEPEPDHDPAHHAAPACDPRYGADIKPFILAKCASSGCHVANFPFGDFTTYTDLKARIDNGKVNTLVFEAKLMPPSNSVKLTAEESEKLKCWMDHGAAQN